MNLCVWRILTLSRYSHFAQGHIPYLFLTYYPLRNSRIVRYNSGIGVQSGNSHFAQDNSGIVPILTLRRTYICIKSWKNFIKSDFKDILLKVATNEWSDETFLLTSKLCPLGAVCPCPGAIYTYKIVKKWYKIRLQRDFFLNLQQMTEVTRCSCWHQNFVPRVLSAPALGLYTCIKSWKKSCIKSDLKEIFF